jgi:hypothetical protein
MKRRPVVNQRRYAAAFDGTEPAEALNSAERELLVCELHAAGLTDIEIAAHTRWSTYTANRIRERLGLPENPTTKGNAA